MKKTITIEGMSCNHCVMRVKNALDELDEVKSAQVDLKSNTATVELENNISDEIFKEVIDDVGYDVIEIK